MAHIEPLDLSRIEALAASGAVPLTHLDRVVYPPHGGRGALLKAHVVDYHLRMASALLPHVSGRPLVLRRYPDGIAGEAFFTKDWTGQPLPDPVRRVPVWSESLETRLEYAVADTPEGLAWVPQTGALEVHPWLSRLGPAPSACATGDGLASAACGLDLPDVLVIDLDPYPDGGKGRGAGGEPGLSRDAWSRAVEAGLAVRDLLRSLGVPCFAKTSGKRGLHVHVPLAPEHPYPEVRAVAKAICAHLAAQRPDRFTLAYDPRERRGRVFLDYNQNVRGKTLAAPWSLRPTPEASVSMPLRWSELEEADPASFTLLTAPTRLAERGDPWAGLDAARRTLRALLDQEEAPRSSTARAQS